MGPPGDDRSAAAKLPDGVDSWHIFDRADSPTRGRAQFESLGTEIDRCPDRGVRHVLVLGVPPRRTSSAWCFPRPRVRLLQLALGGVPRGVVELASLPRRLYTGPWEAYARPQGRSGNRGDTLALVSARVARFESPGTEIGIVLAMNAMISTGSKIFASLTAGRRHGVGLSRASSLVGPRGP